MGYEESEAEKGICLIGEQTGTVCLTSVFVLDWRVPVG